MAVAIVTGANKGLGYETSKHLAMRGFLVIMTGRNKELITEAASKLRVETGIDRIEPFVVDVTNQENIDYLGDYCLQHFPGEVEVLINNAGILQDFSNKSVFNTSIELIRETMETNAYGAFRMCQKFIPMMLDHKKGRVVNVSSGLGQLQDMGSSSAAYRISKVAMNSITCMFASEVRGRNILVNSVCPGWVRTDMGGSNAPRDIKKGAETIVWAGILPDSGPTGKFFRDKQEIPW